MIEHANGKAVESDDWPTARVVAARLGCSRQQVYKLEKRGKLRGKDVRENGVKLRRYDPESVSNLAEDSELEALLGVDAGDEGDEGDDLIAPNGMRLAAKVVSESRQVAVDARRGQQEAFELVTKPAQAFTETLLKALEQRESRIAQLEEKLNKYYDEQREARLEEREAQLFASQMERADQRKDQFFKLFTDNVPLVLEQIKKSAAASAGPFVEWIRELPPQQQKRLVMAVQAVIAEDEPPAASPPEKGTGTDGPI